VSDPIVENRDDVGMLGRPDLWPHRWILPLVRDHEADDQRYGYVLAEDPTTVVLGLIFDAPRTPRHPRRVLRYESAEAVVADGWRVD
jgi:hypothetical protein